MARGKGMGTPSVTIGLGQPYLDGGLRQPHFFNGRYLTAEDLRTEQAAQLERAGLLATAIGTGVVSGLRVEADGEAAVRIDPGVAISPSGQVVRLPDRPVRLAIVPDEAGQEEGAGGLFADCSPPGFTRISAGDGVYLLTAAPAAGYRGQAPMSGAAGDGQITGCGSRYLVEGVQFRLVPYPRKVDLREFTRFGLRERVAERAPDGENAPVEDGGGAVDSGARVTDGAFADRIDWSGVRLERALDGRVGWSGTVGERLPSPDWENLAPIAGELLRRRLVDLELMRSTLAHECLGTDAALLQWEDPFAPTGAPKGVLDAMRADGRLAVSEVPLALLYWADGKIQFLDRWAVRRYPVRPAADLPWAFRGSQRRVAEAEAAVLQFEEQLAEYLAAHKGQVIEARQRLRYLPPVGRLPSSVDGERFFAGFAIRPLSAPPAHLHLRMQEALLLPAIDLRAKSYPALGVYWPAHQQYGIFFRLPAPWSDGGDAGPRADL